MHTHAKSVIVPGEHAVLKKYRNRNVQDCLSGCQDQRASPPSGASKVEAGEEGRGGQGAVGSLLGASLTHAAATSNDPSPCPTLSNVGNVWGLPQVT